MTQNFFTVADQTGRSGQYIKKEETISVIKKILEGYLDKLSDEALLNIEKLSDIGHE